MAAYKYLIFHCTDTPADRDVCQGSIKMWHLAPSYVRSSGEYRFMGKNYKMKGQIKPYFVEIEKYGKVDITTKKGKGWSRVGYSAMIRLDGSLEILIPWNDDDIIDSWEISNGVKGLNSVSRNIVYAGGSEKIFDKMRPKDTLNPSQFITMANIAKIEIAKHPDLLVCGHNQFSSKRCPSFDVLEKFMLMGIPLKNIYNPKDLDLKQYAKDKGIKNLIS